MVPVPALDWCCPLASPAPSPGIPLPGAPDPGSPRGNKGGPSSLPRAAFKRVASTAELYSLTVLETARQVLAGLVSFCGL